METWDFRNEQQREKNTQVNDSVVKNFFELVNFILPFTEIVWMAFS